MPTRPDLRELTTGVRDAFADADRETLLDVLSFVVKEHAPSGPPPMMLHQVETLGDLVNLSFAQLIASLQTRSRDRNWPCLPLMVIMLSAWAALMPPLVAARQAPGAPAPAPMNCRVQRRGCG